MTASFSELVVAEARRRVHVTTDDHDPVRWVQDKLDEEMWSRQRDIMRASRRYRRMAVKSCHGPGKSHLVSRVVSEHLDTHPVGEAFAVTTAPTGSQVKMILWRYIGQAHRKGRLLGRVNQTEWLVGPEPIGFGRKPADWDPTAFQGIHARYVLVVIDEACGVPKSIWDAAETLLTNEHCRIIAIGNPDDPNSHFARVCRPDSGWHVETISAFDTPNFTGEDVSPELKELLISRQYVEDAKKNWGEESALYISKVLGEFPEDADDGVVPASKIVLCRHLDEDAGGKITEITGTVQLGVDVGAGGDQSVIRERRGMVAGRVWRSRHDDSMRLVGEIVNAVRLTGATRVAIDVIGVGWGVAGRLDEVLKEQGLRCQVAKVNVSRAASDPKRFINLRAELWWEIGREYTLNGLWDLRRIDDQTAADLSAPKYLLASGGRIQVEQKADVKQRLGRSPDDADSLLLAFYEGQRPVVLHAPTADMFSQVFAGRPGQATVSR